MRPILRGEKATTWPELSPAGAVCNLPQLYTCGSKYSLIMPLLCCYPRAGNAAAIACTAAAFIAGVTWPYRWRVKATELWPTRSHTIFG